MKELPKSYEASQYEEKIYQAWEKSGFFNPDNLPAGKPFTMVLPPPNATGVLHLGHAVMTAIQDILARFHRLNGKKVLWLPGTDHAAIATQNVVEKKIWEETKKTRFDIGREGLVKQVNEFANSSRGTIQKQLRATGASLDWSRERYTLDEGISEAVKEMFVRMYNDGLIYRGNRIVNWCYRCGTTLADDEVEYKEKSGIFYYLKYGPITIGTARPETKILDKVIIVHPLDSRYQPYIGKEFTVPWIDGNVKARVIADPVADIKTGTGAMTITPAHSFEDFALAQKYNLEVVQIIGQDGKLTSAAGKFAGLNVKEARKSIVAELQKKGLVEKIDDKYVHNLSTCYRCGTPVEPLTSKQWFVSVDKQFKVGLFKKTTLKKLALEAVKSGKIKIIPDRFNKTYFQWIKNLHDWCISRQIWFGHRIPVWYCVGDDKNQCKLECKNPIVETTKPDHCPHCGSKVLKQDPDTLDTWFSSGIWTFATLGWPITKAVGFHELLVPLVQQGTKIKTYRLRDHGLVVGEVCRTHNSQTNKDFGYLLIKKVTKTTIGDLDFNQPGHERFASKEEFLSKMKMYYPAYEVRDGTLVWLYEFKYQNEPDFATFHPTDVLETGYDILFFWIARMIMMTQYAVKQIPFHTVYLHGLVRDKQGRKMSKSTGNGIDPLDMIKKYGTDALRLSMIVGTTAGNDFRLYDEKIAGFRNFVNKLWNIGRYILLTIENVKPGNIPPAKTVADRWILSRLSTITKTVTDHINKFEFSPAAEKLYDFTWHELADWYLEMAKVEKNKDDILSYILDTLLKLWHPFTPFVTEVLWRESWPKEKLLMVQSWPQNDNFFDEKAEREIKKVQDIVTAIRNYRSENKIDKNQVIDCYIDSPTSVIGKDNLLLISGLWTKINLVQKFELTWAKVETDEIKIYFGS